MRILPLLLLTLFCTASLAQNIYPLQAEDDMEIMSVLPVDSSLGIAHLFRPNKPAIIAVINAEAAIVREIAFESGDRIMALGKWKEHTTVLYWTKCRDCDTGNYRQLRARFFDIRGEKVVDDKPLFTNKEKIAINTKVTYNSRKEITGAVLWVCKVKNENVFSNYNSGDYTTPTRLISVQMDNNFSPSVTELTQSKALNNYLIGTCADADGNLYLTSYDKEGITTEKYNGRGALTGSLSHVFEHPFKSTTYDNPVIAMDSISGAPLVALKYYGGHNVPVNTLTQFDFVQQKTNVLVSDLLNKDYKRSLKEANEDRKFVKLNFFNAEFLRPGNIECTPDYIIFLRYTEENFLSGRNSTNNNYNAYFGLVSVFDRKHNLSLKYSAVLDRYLNSPDGSGLPMSTHVIGQKLYTLASQYTSTSPYHKLCFIMDMETGALTRIQLEKMHKMLDVGVESYNTLWLNKGFVISNIVNKTPLFSSKQRWHTMLQKATY